METEFQAALEQLLWFVNQDFKTRGLGDFEQEEVEIILNRDILINESGAVENCAKSAEAVSKNCLIR